MTVTITTSMPAQLERPHRHSVGPLGIDAITFAGALDAIGELIARGKGGLVFTPNVDHVVLADEDARLRAAYASASLSLVDGTILLWASRLLGVRAPEKISGSDLIEPLMERAATRGWRVYLLGGAPGVGERAADVLRGRYPTLQIVGFDAPVIDLDAEPAVHAAIMAPVRQTQPDLVLVALGCPKQEIFMHRVRDELGPAVAIGVGASLDFVAGVVPRAPRWMSRMGVEWLFRLVMEPRRLWRRYLVRDPKFALIVMRILRERRRKSAVPSPSGAPLDR
jgi:N-acetylglucosaminyldiphosphoundecaprenol N-acetyl-beta-D-mannosaminyltransferase